MKILLGTCACIFYVSDNVMTRVHLANNILVHIIMLLFKSHPVYRQLKKVSKKPIALINMVRHFPVLHFPDPVILLRVLLKRCPSFSSPAFSGRAFSLAPIRYVCQLIH